MIAALNFASPVWHWLTAGALALSAVLVALSFVARRRQLAKFADASLLARLLASHSGVLRVVKNALLFLSLAALGLAMARPQWGVTTEPAAHRRGEDVVFVLDLSKSMLARDVTPNRLERAKHVILEYLHTQGGGRVGLVVFAGNAFLRCPLTADYAAFEESVAESSPEDLYVPGSDLANALAVAKNAFEKEATRRVLVLITDGEDLGKLGVETAKAFSEEGVVIFTIGVGTATGSEIAVIQPNGLPGPLLDETGKPVVSRLDEETLRGIADATGGIYRRLDRIRDATTDITRGLRESETKGGLGIARASGTDRYEWVLAVAICLLVAESLLTTRRREKPAMP